MKTKIFTLLVVVFLAASSSFAIEFPWKTALEKENITVLTREVEGSSFDEFQGITLIAAPIDVILYVINDVESNRQWMADCIESYTLEKINEYDKVAYFAQKLPWPVKNRDMVVQSHFQENLANGILKISLQSLNQSEKNKSKKYIRMANMKGEWLLEYQNKNTTKVTYTIKADPSGSIPATIANISSKRIPFVTLEGLKKMVTKDKYSNQAKNSEFRKKMDKLITDDVLK